LIIAIIFTAKGYAPSLCLYSVCSGLFTLVYGAIGVVLIGMAIIATMMEASKEPPTHMLACVATTLHASCLIFHVPSWFYDCREFTNKVCMSVLVRHRLTRARSSVCFV